MIWSSLVVNASSDVGFVGKSAPGIQRLLALDALDPESDAYADFYQAMLQVGEFPLNVVESTE